MQVRRRADGWLHLAVNKHAARHAKQREAYPTWHRMSCLGLVRSISNQKHVLHLEVEGLSGPFVCA